MAKTQKTPPVDCEKTVKRFNEYIDNHIKGNAREQLIQLIMECRDCIERLEFEQLLKSKIRASGRKTSEKGMN